MSINECNCIMNEILEKENLVEPTKMLRLLPISENVKLRTRIMENGPVFDQQQKNSVIFTNFESATLLLIASISYAHCDAIRLEQFEK